MIISDIKRIVFELKIFGIRSLFVPFHFVQHVQQVDTDTNTAVT
jgi:hypothetical protein